MTQDKLPKQSAGYIIEEIPIDQCICGDKPRKQPKPNCWASKHDYEARGK